MSDANNPLVLNVGFIVHQSVGYVREFPFEFDTIHLPPDTKLGNLNGFVRVTRTAQGLLVEVKMTAEMMTECGRCLTEFLQPLEAEFTDLYAFTPNAVTELGLLLPENGKINLGPILRDEMRLSIPITPVCRPDCRGLCQVCGANLNEETCEHLQEEIDPRLDQLKSFLE
jgi:uncharacterized protein